MKSTIKQRRKAFADKKRKLHKAKTKSNHAKRKGKHESKGSSKAQIASKHAHQQSKKNSTCKATVGTDGEVGCTKPMEHNMEAPIIKTKLGHARKGKIRTYLQGMTSDMTESNKRWILITEITQAQSADHLNLMMKVSVVV